MKLKIYFILLPAIILSSCNEKVKESSIKKSLFPYSNINMKLDSIGRPKNNNVLYIPTNIINVSQQLLSNLNKEIKEGKSSDTDYVKWKDWWLKCDTSFAWDISNQLFWLEEPILSNKYSGYDTYRLFTRPSFSNSSIIRVTFIKDSLEIVYKEIGKPLKINKEKGIYKYVIENRKRIILPSAYLDTISTLVGKSMFWTFQQPTIDDGVLDGTEYIFEGHINEGYKAIRRSNIYVDSQFNLFGYLYKIVHQKAG